MEISKIHQKAGKKEVSLRKSSLLLSKSESAETAKCVNARLDLPLPPILPPLSSGF